MRCRAEVVASRGRMNGSSPLTGDRIHVSPETQNTMDRRPLLWTLPLVSIGDIGRSSWDIRCAAESGSPSSSEGLLRPQITNHDPS